MVDEAVKSSDKGPTGDGFDGAGEQPAQARGPAGVAAPPTHCPTCDSAVSRNAKYCTTCERWIAEPTNEKLYRYGERLLQFIISIGLPAAIAFGGITYKKAAEERDRAANTLVRENQVLDRLADSLTHTIELSDNVRHALIQVENACRPAAQNGTTTAAAERLTDCLPAFEAAVVHLDDIVNDLSWAIVTIPVTPDTHQRVSNLKTRWFRPCANDAPEAACGYRALLFRHLYAHGSLTVTSPAGRPEQQEQLRYCVSQTDQAAQEWCLAAIGSMKNDVFTRIHRDLNEVLCGFTRDSNELRTATWRAMQSNDPSGIFRRLPERLDDGQDASRCRDILSPSHGRTEESRDAGPH